MVIFVCFYYSGGDFLVIAGDFFVVMIFFLPTNDIHAYKNIFLQNILSATCLNNMIISLDYLNEF